MKVPTLPTPMETVTGGSCHFCLGGKGANQAVAAARAGGDVLFLSCVGNDSVALEVKQELAANNIPLQGISSIDDTETGKAMIFVDADGENCIGVADGANAHMTPDTLMPNRDAIQAAKVVLLQMEIPTATVQHAASQAREADGIVILNPAPAAGFSHAVLPFVSILTPNQTEMQQISETSCNTEAEMTEAARRLIDQGPQAIIITLGSQGAFAVTEKEAFSIAAHKIKAEDTTAAGDVFNGALAVALAADEELPTAIKFSMAAAALSVQKSGAIPSIPYREQIDGLLKNKA